MSDIDYDTDAKQIATNPLSVAARLDRPTEDALYRCFKEFFREAEEGRRWNLWGDVNWEAVGENPPLPLVAAMLDAYREFLFLPDYSARVLHLLRASRGRAWFLTRWSYEEGKHLLVLAEWLMRCGAYSSDELRIISDAHLLTYQWEPPHDDGIALFADGFVWETRAIERFTALRQSAEDAGDIPLTTALDFVLRDETAHRDFYREVIGIIAQRYAAEVTDAVARAASAAEWAGGVASLTGALGLDLPKTGA